ncbi:MAG: bifunctional phosphoglucose/phosphomannose isomerase, partial [Chloroflexi bacterium]|nr:bifunctional phosphoglucose/phosphomannose isomerase [Chloroflexota bacterium]
SLPPAPFPPMLGEKGSKSFPFTQRLEKGPGDEGLTTHGSSQGNNQKMGPPYKYGDKEMPDFDLDDNASYPSVDPDGMLQRIHDLPGQLTNAWNMIESFPIPGSYASPRNVVILGMGGSAIGADLVRSLVAGESPAPIVVNRDYSLPGFVNEKTMVIASSYSGNTEETLTGFDKAQKRGAKLIALTTGGRLAERSRELGIPVFTFSYQAQPRAALGYSLVPLLGVLEKVGLIGSKKEDILSAQKEMQALAQTIGEGNPESKNPAKQLARRLHNRLPVVYGADILAEVARRWKGQFNENAKAWSAFEVLPELNHNAVVGYEHPQALASQIVVIMLKSSLNEPRNLTRFAVTESILDKRGIEHVAIEARGDNPLANMMTSILFGDYTSYYLSLLYRQNPTPVDIISYLKDELAKRA